MRMTTLAALTFSLVAAVSIGMTRPAFAASGGLDPTFGSPLPGITRGAAVAAVAAVVLVVGLGGRWPGSGVGDSTPARAVRQKG